MFSSVDYDLVLDFSSISKVRTDSKSFGKYNIDDYYYDEEQGLMISPSLDKIITDLFPYGMIKGISEKEINDLDKEKIAVIGNNINNSIQGINRIQGLISITRLLCPTEKETEDINKINEMNENFHNLELVKKIKSEIE